MQTKKLLLLLLKLMGVLPQTPVGTGPSLQELKNVIKVNMCSSFSNKTVIKLRLFPSWYESSKEVRAVIFKWLVLLDSKSIWGRNSAACGLMAVTRCKYQNLCFQLKECYFVTMQSFLNIYCIPELSMHFMRISYHKRWMRQPWKCPCLIRLAMTNRFSNAFADMLHIAWVNVNQFLSL